MLFYSFFHPLILKDFFSGLIKHDQALFVRPLYDTTSFLEFDLNGYNPSAWVVWTRILPVNCGFPLSDSP